MLISCIMRHLDATDSKLLLALVDDPRGTVVALAERLELSRNTVQARMSGLEARGQSLAQMADDLELRDVADTFDVNAMGALRVAVASPFPTLNCSPSSIFTVM